MLIKHRGVSFFASACNPTGSLLADLVESCNLPIIALYACYGCLLQRSVSALPAGHTTCVCLITVSVAAAIITPPLVVPFLTCSSKYPASFDTVLLLLLACRPWTAAIVWVGPSPSLCDRLVTAGTIEARIVTRAGQKRQVQQLVMAEGATAAAAAAAGLSVLT